MGEKYLGQLTAKSAPAIGDILVLEDSEDTKKIDYDALANAILNKLTTKTYTVAGGTNTLIAAIDALNGESFSIAGNSTVNLNIANNTRAVLYVLTNANDGMNIILVSCSSAGAVYKSIIGTSASLTITSSTNSLSITRTTAGGGSIFARVYAGSVTLAS